MSFSTCILLDLSKSQFCEIDSDIKPSSILLLHGALEHSILCKKLGRAYNCQEKHSLN